VSKSVLARSVTSSDGTRIGYETVSTRAGTDEDGVIVVGGALRTAQDYLPFAWRLARDRVVHVMDRRGRGTSGPQGPGYTIEKECEDLLAVQAATGARDVFGHSFGGLVTLEAARRAPVFTRIAVYEPGVSIGASIPTDWMPRYRQLLDAGDARGAFAHFLRASGHAPRPVRALPLWYLRTVLRLVIRKTQWQRMEPLLQANLAEHEQVIALDDTVASYAAITANVLLLGGGNSPAFTSRIPLEALHRAIPSSSVGIIDRLDHNAPDDRAPEAVADHVLRFLLSPT
jgi:pimeloyl-ACP methyl ester carboxylesterase